MFNLDKLMYLKSKKYTLIQNIILLASASAITIRDVNFVSSLSFEAKISRESSYNHYANFKIRKVNCDPMSQCRKIVPCKIIFLARFTCKINF